MTVDLGNVEYVDLGNFPQGEIPDPLEYEYQDAEGNPINLSTGSADFAFSIDGGAEESGGAPVDMTNAASGIVTYPWVATDMDDVGHYEAQFKVVKGAQIYKSHVIRWWVYDTVIT